MGKDLMEVRSPQRKLMPDTQDWTNIEQTSLRGIAMRAAACKDCRFRNLYRELNEPLLHACWRDLNKNAASGVDGVTAEEYRGNLDSNIAALVEKLKTKRYRAKLVRRHYIPKTKGKMRPLGIPALEDKLVQLACSRILSAIYEQDFVPVSYAYRPGRSARHAVEDLSYNLQLGGYGYVVEADIKGFFDNLDHDWLYRMLEQRVDDKAFLGLIRKWLKAGILETDGKIVHPLTGSPQGGIISPILANIYLHYALDLWFEKVVKRKVAGKAFIVRYADDFVCAFQLQGDASRFFRQLPDRLGKFGLQLAADKTRILRFSRQLPGMERRFTFLGFEFYWFPSRTGKMLIHQRTAPKKLQAARRRIRRWIYANRSIDGRKFISGLKRRLTGHYNYYGIRGNSAAITAFYRWTIACTFKWLNRRGGKRRSFNWKSFWKALDRVGVPKPRIVIKERKHIIFA